MPWQRRPNNSVTMTYEESRAKLKQQIIDTETSSSINESFTSCEESWSSRYDVRGTVEAGLRRERNLGWSTTGLGTMRNLESDSQLHPFSGTKSLRCARNRRGRFTSCEEIWSSRYDVQETVGAGLRRARKVSQVAMTCKEPSGQVYDVHLGQVATMNDAARRQGLTRQILLSLKGEDIYGIDETGKLREWYCCHDDKRRGMTREGLSSPDFLLVKYGGSQGSDLIWENRYAEWCDKNSISSPSTSKLNAAWLDSKPKPRDYTFKEWMLIKVGHTNVNESVKRTMLKSWVIDCFEAELGPTKDPQSRTLMTTNGCWI
ncbi:hypothetical protein Tco_0701670 [Tanacetum coccineum]